MPIPLGILAQFRQAAAGDFVLLETQVLGSNQASVTFSNLGTLAAGYKHLQLRMAVRTASGSESYLYMTMNGANSGYADHGLEGNGSSVISFAGTNTALMFMGVLASAQQASNIYSAFVTDILDPFVTSKNKTIRTLGGYATRSIALTSGLYASTSSVSSITLRAEGTTNFVTGSRFSLYGVKG